jgi:type 1 glutamine amidotransferase/HEAT repeat protein
MTISRFALLALSSVLAASAALPPEIREAVERVRTFDGAEPTAPLHRLTLYTPRAAGNPVERQELAALLAEAATSTGATAFGRTILCQQLNLVAGESERPALEKLAADPAAAADAAIALASMRGGSESPAPPNREACLAKVALDQPAERIAGLTLLARFHPQAAQSEALKAFGDPDDAVVATAIQVAAGHATRALIGRLESLPPSRQAIALEALAARRAEDAAPTIAGLLSSADPAVLHAAVRALGELGDADVLPDFATLVEARPELAATVTEALAVLSSDGIDAAILSALPAAAPGYRACLLRAAASRGSPGLTTALLAEARGTNATVQVEAFKALARVGDAAAYPQLVQLLAESRHPEAGRAVAAVARRVTDDAARWAPLHATLTAPAPSPETLVAVLRILPVIGGPDALAAIRVHCQHANPLVGDAAIRALADWPETKALPLLLSLGSQSTNRTHRALALRGVVRLAADGENPIDSLTSAIPLAASADDRRLLLGALAATKDANALPLVAKLADDPEVKTEALAARRALELNRAPSLVRREELAAQLAPGRKLVAYLNCGVATDSALAGPPRLRLQAGRSFAWAEPTVNSNLAAASCAFDGDKVRFEVSGLDPKQVYTLGFTWWDFDGKGREASVWADGQPLLGRTRLPAWAGKREEPASFRLPLSAAAIQDGSVALEFRREGTDNMPVSEVWLEQGGAPTPPAPPPAPAAMPEVRANAGAATKVLIVTGLDYPGHKWKETTPVLTAHLAKDPRLEISVTEDARSLAAPTLTNYACIVLHYMNWQDPGPGAAAQENLRKTLEAGTGMVLVHFACGAFQEWPEFVKIAGRVWDPKLRGHDPYGLFTVRIVDAAHPITAGLRDFSTTDELYTCLAGDTPVHLLCDAASKVDQKPYPMAFTLDYGKGRVFLSTLGHDVKAFNDEAGQLYRRGTAWAAGLIPQG